MPASALTCGTHQCTSLGTWEINVCRISNSTHSILVSTTPGLSTTNHTLNSSINPFILTRQYFIIEVHNSKHYMKIIATSTKCLPFNSAPPQECSKAHHAFPLHTCIAGFLLLQHMFSIHSRNLAPCTPQHLCTIHLQKCWMSDEAAARMPYVIYCSLTSIQLTYSNP